MQAQMQLMQALEQYAMLDFANIALDQCWEICYNTKLSREELAKADTPDTKVSKMDACGRKCINRQFEVMNLAQEAKMAREREMMQQYAGQ